MARRKKAAPARQRSMPVIDGVQLDALPDVPDFRDRYYEPTLRDLLPALTPPNDLSILDQGKEGACTGFELAAVANFLYRRRDVELQVSERMLYEMARLHDEWPGENYDGSSCRGAIKGWYHMGVCLAKDWRYEASKPGHLTLNRARGARHHTIGAYYLIRKNIVDMHAALTEVGAVYVSADVHSGWSKREASDGVISINGSPLGGHAFTVVGYDDTGFIVQNSWGPGWGKDGLAHWSYEDWIDNVRDAWVVQLALSTPQLYSRRRTSKSADGKAQLSIVGPRRDEIAGHFVHIDDGAFHDSGKYWSTLKDVGETARYVATAQNHDGASGYDHLLFYAHGGLNSVKASAARIAAMRDTFKRNGVYPYHFMYDTGLLEQLKDVVFGKKDAVNDCAGGFTDWTDRLIEHATRRPGRAIWREMKDDARIAFDKKSRAGLQVLDVFLKAFDAADAVPKHIHLAGHSTGAILDAYLVLALARLKRKVRLKSVSLLAPAATVELFETAFLPHINKSGFGIDQLNIYNLNDQLEQDDHVARAYNKSLLYLVSRAFEEDVSNDGEAIVGMQRYSKAVEGIKPAQLKVLYSNGVASSRDRTNATTHGGFDNDPATMNDILKTVLGAKPAHPFDRETLRY